MLLILYKIPLDQFLFLLLPPPYLFSSCHLVIAMRTSWQTRWIISQPVYSKVNALLYYANLNLFIFLPLQYKTCEWRFACMCRDIFLFVSMYVCAKFTWRIARDLHLRRIFVGLVELVELVVHWRGKSSPMVGRTKHIISLKHPVV